MRLFLLISVVFSVEVFSAPLTNLYWGDLHVHSNRPSDSFSFGNSRLTPDNTYQLSKGETVKTNRGEYVTLRKALEGC